MLFSCIPIGQRCLGGRVYSNRNVNEIITAFLPFILLPLFKTCRVFDRVLSGGGDRVVQPSSLPYLAFPAPAPFFMRFLPLTLFHMPTPVGFRETIAKLNEKKSDRELEREIKKQRRHFSLEEQHENFVAAPRK